MSDGKLFIAGMRVVPKKSLSKTVRGLASIRSRMAVRQFAARFGVAVDDAEKPIEEYTSVLDFFTRRLKPGIRPVDPDPNTLVSPVDGTFSTGGPIGEGRLFQAKGKEFTLQALLADEEALSTFAGGTYATLYLAPKDYHRIHAPVGGVVTGYTYVPGQLFPVNAAAVANVDQLFAINERLITHMETERFGRVEVVKVGATCVGHITAAYDPEVKTNAGDRELRVQRYDPPIPLEKGAELGCFEMGSTVILVTEARVDLADLVPDTPVLMGSRLARFAR